MRRWIWLLPLAAAIALAAYVILGHGPQTVPTRPQTSTPSEDEPPAVALANPGAAAKPKLPVIPTLPEGARPSDTAADFDRLADEHPDLATATRTALFEAFTEMDLHSCLPSWGLQGDITLELTVQAEVTAQFAVFRDAKLVRVVNGMQVPPETVRCVEQRFGERRMKTHRDAPMLTYRGEIIHTVTLHVDDGKTPLR